MKIRIISSIVGIILLGIVVYFFNTMVLDIAVALLSAIATHELINCVGLSKNKPFEILCLFFSVCFSSIYLNIFSSLTLLAEFIFAGILLIFLLADHKNMNASNALLCFFSATVIPRAFSMILLYRQYESPISYYLLALAFAVAWLNDIFALFSGMAFGKHKLCPQISPKKTVEGAVGGVVCDVILCTVISYLLMPVFDLNIHWVSLLLFLPVGAISGIFGDLSASIIKRQNNIKDYGNIMPGHGGVMDRFDSWLFVAPLLYIWNIYFPVIG